ncbi:MAG TPA: SUMF1/EgtB/PvdO family nonheme iron enzyme [Planctomycetota bacterium]|jgi:formylglycine-generating enzyme required for sulfatase activity/serine/threonine protein kinase/Leucine-rich repeat (LRR) protein
MSNPVSDEAFARALNQMGMVTLDQIETARTAQAESARNGVLVSLPDVFIQQGVITPVIRENVEKKLQAQQAGGIKQLAHFKLVKKLGEGGMGAVYQAEDLNVGRLVAVKVLPKKHAGDADFVTRFRREAKAAGALNHVNIVAAYSYGEDQGYHYLAMELCEGEPLDKKLKREGPLSWDQATQIVMQVARGLKHAHEHGFIHRDIKPANIMLCKPLNASTIGEVGVAKILDMGLSKNIGGGEQSFATQTGVALGTPHYISPEQARGDKGVDGRSDIYSLGAMFYHLVTGQTPFQGTTAAAILLKHLNEQLSNPQDIREDIPDPVVQVIQKMMAKDAIDRYRDCNELLADLELVIDGKMPSSNAIDVGKSSVAMPRAPRRAATAPRKTAGPLAPAGTRPHAPATRHTGEQRASTSARPNKTPLYIAGGVLALGLLILIYALTSGGKSGQGDAETGTTARRGDGETGGRGETAKAAPAEIARSKPETRPVAVQPEAALPKDLSLDLGGGVKMEMVLVPAGEFMMGSDDADAKPQEKPVHKVQISKPFYMGKYPVTIAQFRAFVDAMKFQTEAEKAGNRGYTWDNGWKEVSGVNWMKPNFPQEDNHPVCLVTWSDAQEFCKWAAKKTGRNACLPTEAQWEYAGRAGTTTKFNTGDKDSDLEQAGWCTNNSGMRTHPVGQKKPNSWGLYDMLGNVLQWVQDNFNDKYYADSPPVDPKGPASGGDRVLRGGSWSNRASDCGSARRYWISPGRRNPDIGFRLALDVSAAGADVDAQRETGVTDAWVKMVQALPAGEQFKKVVEKLKELNPRYDGKATQAYTNGIITDLGLTGAAISDISPLKSLKLIGLKLGSTAVSDLTPLLGMPIGHLEIDHTQVRDLTPLRGAPGSKMTWTLGRLYMNDTPVTDLSPLADLPKLYLLTFSPATVTRGIDSIRAMKTLTQIGTSGDKLKSPQEFWKEYDAARGGVDDAWIKMVHALPPEEQIKKVMEKLKELNDQRATVNAQIVDKSSVWFAHVNCRNLTPLKGFPALRAVWLNGGEATDLAGLSGMALTEINCTGRPISDLSPLRGMKLTKLQLRGTKVTDLSLLTEMPLTELTCDFVPARDTAILKSIKTLEKLNDLPVAEFWAKNSVPAAGGVDDAWIKMVQALPAEKQVEAVVAKLRDVNPGWNGPILESKVVNGQVQLLHISSIALKDLSPIKALVGLSDLECRPHTQAKGNLEDLTPLRGMKLQILALQNNNIHELSPLQGIPLTHLYVASNPVENLAPLKGLSLITLDIKKTQVGDLAPIRDLPIKHLVCDFVVARDAAILGSIKTLEKINEVPVAEFWAKNPLSAAAAKPEPPGAVVYLSDLPEQEVKVFTYNGHAMWAKNGGADDLAIVVNNVPSPKGLLMYPGHSAGSHVAYALVGKYQAFEASAAINDSAQNKTVTALTFKVVGDGKLLWASQPTKESGKAQSCRVEVAGVQKLELSVECPGNCANARAVWVEPRLTPVGAPAAPKGVLLSEDFEKLDLNKLPQWWTIGPKSQVAIVELPGHGKVLRISRKERDRGEAKMTIPIDPALVAGHSLRVSVSACCPLGYTPVPAPDGWAQPRVLLKVQGDERPCRNLPPEQRDWQQLVTPLWKIPADAREISVSIGVPFVAAEVFFDDLIIELDPEPNTKPPRLSAEAAPAGADNDPARWAKAVNLLPLVDPKRDALDTTWSFNGATLSKSVFAQGMLEMPFHPAEEYDCRVEFTPTKGAHWIGGSLFHNGERFWWRIDEQYACLNTINGKLAQDQATVKRSLMKPGERNTVIVQVRRNSVVFTVNGESVVTYKSEMGPLTDRTDWPPRDRNTMGLKALGQYTFHGIDVLEISGKGTFTRPGDPAAKEAERQRNNK